MATPGPPDKWASKGSGGQEGRRAKKENKGHRDPKDNGALRDPKEGTVGRV